MVHLWFNFVYLDTCEAAILSLLNEGHLDRMLRNLNKIILLIFGATVLSLLNEGHLDRMLRNLNKIILLS